MYRNKKSPQISPLHANSKRQLRPAPSALRIKQQMTTTNKNDRNFFTLRNPVNVAQFEEIMKKERQAYIDSYNNFNSSHDVSNRQNRS